MSSSSSSLKRPFPIIGSASGISPISPFNPAIQGKVSSVLGQVSRSSDLQIKRNFAVVEDDSGTPVCVVKINEGNLLAGKVETKLGEGGFGVVYQVKFEEREKTAALKIAPAENTTKGIRYAPSVAEIQKELEIMENVARKINSPVSVRGLLTPMPDARVYQVSPEGNSCVGFLMEEKGNSYRKWADANKKHLFWGRIGQEFKDVANGLRTLHENDYLHRDLNPENILANEKGATIIDYGKMQKISGLATRIDDDLDTLDPFVPIEDTKRFNALPGCIEEERDAKRRKLLEKELPALGKAIDIFSLGLALYIRCYNTTPYEMEGDHQNAKVSQNVNGVEVPIRPKQIRDIRLPNGLKALIEEMVDPDPKKRPSAISVLDRLETIFPLDESSDPDWNVGMWNPKRNG